MEKGDQKTKRKKKEFVGKCSFTTVAKKAPRQTTPLPALLCSLSLQGFAFAGGSELNLPSSTIGRGSAVCLVWVDKD